MSAILILAFVAGALAIISMFPATEKFPLLSVASLLLAICVFLMTGGH